MAMGAQHPTAVDCLLTLENRTVPDDVIGLHEHREVLKLQELVLQDKLLQREREIQAKDNENEEIRAKLEATVEAQAQMR